MAIIGRANVGKSTLFNRLTRSSKALVADIPGVTRDRHYGSLTFDDRAFLLVDTGGLVGGEDEMSSLVRHQAEEAVAEARRHPPGGRRPGRPPDGRRPGGRFSAPHRQDRAPGGEQDRLPWPRGQRRRILPLRPGLHLSRLRHPGPGQRLPVGGHRRPPAPGAGNLRPGPGHPRGGPGPPPTSANPLSSIASWERNACW